MCVSGGFARDNGSVVVLVVLVDSLSVDTPLWRDEDGYPADRDLGSPSGEDFDIPESM